MRLERSFSSKRLVKATMTCGRLHAGTRREWTGETRRRASQDSRGGNSLRREGFKDWYRRFSVKPIAWRNLSHLFFTWTLRAQEAGLLPRTEVATLLDVVNHYSFKSLNLTEQEKNDLVEFLKSL